MSLGGATVARSDRPVSYSFKVRVNFISRKFILIDDNLLFKFITAILLLMNVYLTKQSMDTKSTFIKQALSSFSEGELNFMFCFLA